jgi:hypothetical protein
VGVTQNIDEKSAAKWIKMTNGNVVNLKLDNNVVAVL